MFFKNKPNKELLAVEKKAKAKERLVTKDEVKILGKALSPHEKKLHRIRSLRAEILEAQSAQALRGISFEAQARKNERNLDYNQKKIDALKEKLDKLELEEGMVFTRKLGL